MNQPEHEDIGRAGARLVAAIRDGDTTAWEELIHTFGGLVRQVTHLAELTEADAEEVFQETWISLYRQLAQLRSPAALARWITRTAARQCAFVRRRNGSAGELSDGEPPTTPTPAELAALEEAGLVREEVIALPEPCRTLLLALFYEKHAPSYAELGARLGRDANSIGSKRQRCLAHLGARLEHRGLK